MGSATGTSMATGVGTSWLPGACRPAARRCLGRRRRSTAFRLVGAVSVSLPAEEAADGRGPAAPLPVVPHWPVAPRSGCSAPGTSRGAASAPAPGRQPSALPLRVAASAGPGSTNPGRVVPRGSSVQVRVEAGRRVGPGTSIGRWGWTAPARVPPGRPDGSGPRRVRLGRRGPAPPGRRRPARWVAEHRAAGCATRSRSGPGQRWRSAPNPPAQDGSRRWGSPPARRRSGCGPGTRRESPPSRAARSVRRRGAAVPVPGATAERPAVRYSPTYVPSPLAGPGRAGGLCRAPSLPRPAIVELTNSRCNLHER